MVLFIFRLVQDISFEFLGSGKPHQVKFELKIGLVPVSSVEVWEKSAGRTNRETNIFRKQWKS